MGGVKGKGFAKTYIRGRLKAIFWHAPETEGFARWSRDRKTERNVPLYDL